MHNKYFYIGIIIILIYPFKRLYPLENSSQLYKEGARLAVNGQIDNAIAAFKKVVEISPYYCLGHYGLGKAYLYKRGMLDQAIVHLEKAVILDRKLAKGHFYLGMAYFFSKKYMYALHSFQEAYNQDDTLIEALYNMSAIYDIIDKSYKAGVYYKKYLAEKLKEKEDIKF